MDRKQIVEVLIDLANGVDPETGEIHGEGSPYHSVFVVRALFLAARELEAIDALFEHKETGADFAARLPPVEGDERLLLDRLRAWRTEVATREQIPLFFVLSNRTLHALAILKPTTPAELLRVFGIGPKRSEQFGPEILRIIAAHEREVTQESGESTSPEEGWLDASSVQERRNVEAGIPRRAYASWSKQEERELRKLHSEGMSEGELAKHFLRQRGAIRSRLQKLNLVE